MRPVLEMLEDRMLLSVVFSFQGFGPGVDLLHREQEPNDTLETATPLDHFAIGMPCSIDVNTGITHCPPEVFQGDATLGGPDAASPDVDFFKFPALAGNRMTIWLRGDAAARDLIVSLLDSRGNELGNAQPSETAAGLIRGYSFETTAILDGDYFIRVTTNDATAELGDRYELGATLRADEHAEREPNDTLEQANPIPLTPRFECWEVCIASTEPGVAPSSASATTATGVQGDGLANVAIFPPPWQAGSQRGFVTGSLDGKLCDMCEAPVNVFLADVDFFSFSTDAESNITVTLVGDAASASVPLQLLDASGMVLASAEAGDPAADGVSDREEIGFFSRSGGDFFVRVGPGGQSMITPLSLQYTLYVNVTTEVVSNPVEGPDEHEPNDTMEQANEVELPRVGDVVCLAIGCPPVPLPGEHSRYREVHGIAGGPTHDVDYFSFRVLAGEQLSVGLGRVWRIELEPQATTIDSQPNPQTLFFVTVFDAVGNEIGRTGGDSGNTILFESESGGVYFARVELQPDGPDAEVADYRLHLHASKFNHEGPDESEPNDTFDQADPIELVSLPTFAPGIELRGGDAHGIAGGPSHDQDVFSFEVQAGEHVTVGVTGFGRSLGECLGGFVSNGTVCVQACPALPAPCDEPLPLFVQDYPIHVTVFDSEGNEIGQSTGSDGHPDGVAFDAAAAGQYFAVVSVSPDTDRLVRYRLGVLARMTLQPEELHFDEPPLEITLRHGQSFRYTDSDGDAVQIVFQGHGGAAHIMFDGSDANGSEIVSVAIAGVRSGGNFRVRTNGSAEVGSLEIDGPAGRARRSSSFGNVSIDGNLGSYSSNLSLRSLVVDGILGDLSAPGRQIGQVSAMVFDRAMADVGSIRSLQVDEELSAAIFGLFLPEEGQP